MRSFVAALMLLMAGAWAAGNGSRGNPLTVESAQDLEDLRLAVITGTEYKGVPVPDMGRGMFFKQTADIDLSTKYGREKGNWKAIGPFAGSYDGGGFKISNLFVDEDVDVTMTPALFGPIMVDTDDTLYFENIVVDKAYLHVSATTGAIITQVVSGVVVVRNNTVNLEYKSGATAEGSQVGGIMGNAVSGWVGFYNNTVKGSFQATSSDGMTIGGLIGTLVTNGNFTGNTNEANITAKGDISVTVGGLAGENLSSTVVKGNTNKGNIQVEANKGIPFIGGLIGVSAVYGYRNTYVGNVNYGKIEFTGKDASLGGLFGLIQGDETLALDSCINQADVIYHGTGSQEIVYVGGIAGLWETMSGSRLQNFGNITVENADNPFVGGLVGYVRDGTKSITLKESVNRGKITVKKDTTVDGKIAGLVGTTDSLQFAELDSCTNMGDIEIIGTADQTLVTSEYAIVYSGVRFQANACKNEGSVLFLDGTIGIPTPVVAKSMEIRVAQVGEGRITLEIPGMESFAAGRVRAGVFSYDGRRLPVNLNASGNLLHLEGLPSAGRFLVRVSTPSGNRSIPVTLH
jgi:hypothetical protein